MKSFPRLSPLWCLLALSPHAYATVLVPTKVRNDTQFAIRITVTRNVSCAGSDQSKSGPWVIDDILAPAQSVSRDDQGGKRDNQDGKFFEEAFFEPFGSDLTPLEAI